MLSVHDYKLINEHSFTLYRKLVMNTLLPNTTMSFEKKQKSYADSKNAIYSFCVEQTLLFLQCCYIMCRIFSVLLL